jgi:hypothetical protein
MGSFGFAHHGFAGQIDVAVAANTEPSRLGCGDGSVNLPVCTAHVRFDGNGYDAMFGWIQLVRSTEAASDGFEMDPFVLFADVAVPYCFYGHKPTLFDAPGRPHRDDMEWTAHTFLAVTPIESGARGVTPVQGFSWGFRIQDGEVHLAAVLPLTPDHWADHLPYLAATYPDWTFDPAPRWSAQ